MKKKNIGRMILFAIPIVVYTIFYFLQPTRFGGFRSMLTLFQQSLLASVTAAGFYFIIEMGLIDFSIGANLVLSAIVGVRLTETFGLSGLLLGCILTGTFVGFLNGIVYRIMKIPSVIVTVGLMIAYEAVGTMVYSAGVLNLNNDFRLFSHMPWNILMAVAAFILAYLIIGYTRLGTYATAIGSNETAVFRLGIDVMKYKMAAFITCGFFVGVSAVLTVSYSASISATLNMATMDRNFLPLMGCFVGVAFKKYINPVLSILIGEFTISMITTGLITNGIDANLQKVIVGLILIFIVAANATRDKEAVVK